jgi:hypothetical protein
VGLERGPLSLVSTIEELLGRKSSDSGLEIREYGRRDPSLLTRDILYPQKLALTSPASGGRSVGMVLSRTKAMEFSLVIVAVTLTVVMLHLWQQLCNIRVCIKAIGITASGARHTDWEPLFF